MKHLFSLSIIIFIINIFAFAGSNPNDKKENTTGNVSKNFSLTGTIEDADNREKLVCAKVEIENLGVKVFTDIEGNFEINDITSGDFTIKISYISYQEIEINAADINKKNVLNIQLKPL